MDKFLHNSKVYSKTFSNNIIINIACMILQHLYKHNYLGGTGFFFYEQQGMICDCNTMRARIKKFLKF